MKVFRAKFKDRALNIRTVEYESVQWAEAICIAFSKKKAEEKLILIECVKDEEGSIAPASDEGFDREKWLEAVDIPVEPGKHRRFV